MTKQLHGPMSRTTAIRALSVWWYLTMWVIFEEDLVVWDERRRWYVRTRQVCTGAWSTVRQLYWLPKIQHLSTNNKLVIGDTSSMITGHESPMRSCLWIVECSPDGDKHGQIDLVTDAGPDVGRALFLALSSRKSFHYVSAVCRVLWQSLRATASEMYDH